MGSQERFIEKNRDRYDQSTEEAVEVEYKQTKSFAWTNEQIDLMRKTICKDFNDDELKLFLYQASRMGLDPLARQIYAQKRKNHKTGTESVTVITSIDGYRLIADRTGLYAGSDDAVFDNEEKPKKATVTVYKMINNQRCPFTASSRWEQYCPPPGQDRMWQKMPHLMIGKVAEALALRKAFPADLSGVYTDAEMEQTNLNDAVQTDPGVAEQINNDKTPVQNEKQNKVKMISERQIGIIKQFLKETQTPPENFIEYLKHAFDVENIHELTTTQASVIVGLKFKKKLLEAVTGGK